MKKHMSNLLAVFIVVAFAASIIPIAFSWSKAKAHHNTIAEMTAHVDTSLVTSGFIVVNFEGQVISGCGDSQLLGFLRTPTGLSLQLKPIFLPHEKAMELTELPTQSILWPISDIYAFLADGVYTLEVFVKNDCSILDSSLVKLIPAPMIIGEMV